MQHRLIPALLVAGTAALAPAAQAQTLPVQAFSIGIGGGFVDADFGSQDVYAIGTSDVYQDGVLIATGEAAGPAGLTMPDESGLAPLLQASYFRQAPGGGWVWGAKMSYAHLGASASLRDVRLPQAGAFTSVPGGETTPFTGNAIARSYETRVSHQVALTPFVGRTFERGFAYLGLGPTLSRARTDIDGLVGFADINGDRQDISGAPQDFSDSEWVLGGVATAGVTYFLSENLFLDVSYSYARTQSYKSDYSGTFVNPGADGRLTEGDLVGDSSGRLVTQGFAATINWAF